MNYPPYLDAIVGQSGISSPLRSLFFDGVTGLPTLPLVLESLKDTAARYQKLGLILIHTDPLERLEQEFGWELLDKLMGQIPTFLDTVASRFAPLKLFSVQRLPGDTFLLVVYSDDLDHPLTRAQVAKISDFLQEKLSEYLAARVQPTVIPSARIFNGYSVLENNSNMRFERLLSRSINRAFQAAINQEESVRQGHVEQLKDVVSSNQIRILFQPILNLTDTTEVLGHEALSRGPEGSSFEKAEFMFSLAGHCGLLTQLEEICQTRLIASLEEKDWSDYIFVNLEPSFLEQDQYRTLPLFSYPAVKPQQVVIEITERIAINDYTVVSRALDEIRKLGFRIAVDDVGSGYASLQSIAYLKPDFIKINQKMVQGISTDFIKQEIVKTLREMASRFSSSLIAEGIEEETDLKTLQKLGVPFGQGFLLKSPAESLLP